MEQREINRYWDICCQREPEIPVIRTTFEEFLILNQKLDEISTNLFNFRKTVKDRLNKFELLLEFVKTQEQILPQSLITIYHKLTVNLYVEKSIIQLNYFQD